MGNVTLVNPSPENEPRPLQRPRRRRWVFGLAAFSMAVLLSLLLVEAAFRWFVPVTDVPFQFWDPVVGLRRFPHQRGISMSGQSVRAWYNFNAQGWNYPTDFSFARPAGTRRICLVGDSYVESLQVDCDQQMAVLLEKGLSRPDRPVECYPFGVSGYGTAQEYQIIRHYALEYKPDIVILFFTANDVYDASPYLSPVDPVYARYRLDGDGQLEPMSMASWTPSGFRRWASKFALARYLLVQKRLLNPRRAAGPAGVTLRETTGHTTADQFPGLGMTRDEQGKKSWALVERLLAAAKSDCTAQGSTLVLVYRGHLPAIEAAEGGPAYEPPPRERDPYCLDERIHEMGKDYLAPMANRLGIPYLDLTESLVKRVRETGRPHNFSDDDHYNELGHTVAAEEMARLVGGLLERSPQK